MTSEFICPLPFKSISIDSDQRLRLCCHSKGTIEKLQLKNNTKISDIQEHPSLKDIRSKMLEGVVPSYCQGCKELEDANMFSPRLDYINRLGNTQIVSPPEYIDITVDNICNLSCRMCSPEYSSNLTSLFESLNIPFNKYSTSKEEILNLIEMIKKLEKNPKMITLTGGEPFKSPYLLSILESFKDKGLQETEIRIFTNSSLPECKVIEVLKSFKKVQLIISLDGAHSTAEYIRYPSKWKKIKENIEKLITYRKILSLEISIHSVFQAYNSLTIASLFEELEVYKENIPNIPSITILESPTLLCSKKLPIKVLKKGKEKIENYWKGFINDGPHKHENSLNYQLWINAFDEAIVNNQEDLISFLTFTKSVDKRRNQNFQEIMPELVNYMKGRDDS